MTAAELVAHLRALDVLTILEVHADVRALFTDVTMPNLDGLSLAKTA